MKCVCVIKHSYTKVFIAALYNAGIYIVMPRHELAKAIAIYPIQITACTQE